MSARAWIRVLAAALVGAGCNAEVVEGGWSNEGATPDFASIANKCAASDAGPTLVTVHDTLIEVLPGRWYRCGAAGPNVGFAPEAIELTSGYQWYALVPGESGAYVRSTAAGGSGTFGAYKALAACCPDDDALSFDDGGHYDLLGFGTSPTRMSWSHDETPDGGVELRIVGAQYVQ